MKQLQQFGQGANENEYQLRVLAFDIEAKDVKEIRKEIDKLSATVKYTTIDADGIGAEISGTYEKVLESLKTLEESGWAW